MTLQNYLQQHYTPDTVKCYIHEINVFLSNNPQAASAGYTELIGYIGRLRERYSNPATLHRILASIKVYYDYLCRSGQREDHPARAIRLRDQRSRDVQLQELFTPVELARLLDVKERFTRHYYRNKVLVSLLIYQGLRPQEMALLRVCDVCLQDETIYIAPTATSNSRTLPLHPAQVLLMYSYLQHDRQRLLRQHESERLLIGGRRRPMGKDDITSHVTRRYGDLYPGRRLSAGTIRASVIANLLAEGRDISEVQAFAGHKYPSSTERYKQSQVAVMQTAIDQYHPMK